MADPLSISVIVPTRDRPAMLAEALASVLAQTRPADELIVVDDSGAGEAARVLRDLRNAGGPEAMALWGPGRGPGAARNVGLRAATGNLIAFLDDDDLWRPTKLAEQVAWFAHRPRLGLLGTSAVPHAGPPPRERPPVESLSMRALLRANRLTTSSVIARRQCLADGFDESLPLAQDWDMWLRIARHWQVARLSLPLVVYRRHDGQRSADRMQMRRWEAAVIARAIARGDAEGLAGVARRRLAWAHARLGRALARNGEADLAREELRASARIFPFNPVVWAALARCAFVSHAPQGAKP